MNDCIFCKIIKREAPATIVYEDDNCIAIIPIKQAQEGHTLVIPKNHSENILDIEDNDLQTLVVAAKKIGQGLMKEYNATGINLLHAAGKDAQQSVFHFHFHLIPRHAGDGMDWWVKKDL